MSRKEEERGDAGALPDDPRVSVLITAYNHEAFVRKAVESALAQETTFPIEILVGDDFSTDGTGSIIDDIASAHPDRVRTFHSETNQGGHVNFSRLYTAARGQYVALLEGDDYWIDPGKLEKQAAFLDANPDFAICAHRVRVVHTTKNEENRKPDEITNVGDPSESGLDRITRFNYIRTASCVFRNGLIPGLPKWVFSIPLGDWPLFILLAEHGKIRILEDEMAVYRIHGMGFWSGLTERKRLTETVRVAEVCREHLGHPGFDDCIFKTSKRIAVDALKSGHLPLAAQYAWKSFLARRRQK